MEEAVAFGLTGVAAGALGRWLLGRLRRGTSVHFGWIEGPVAVLWTLVGLRLAGGHLPWWWLPVPLLLTWFAALLTATDLRHRRLPDALTLPAYPVAAAILVAAAGFGGGQRVLLDAALGAGAFLGLYGLVHLLWRGSLGAGDVKLSGSLGAVLGAVGWPALVLAAWLAAVCTLGLRLLAPRRVAAGWRDGIPHGPGLLAATCVVALFPGLR